MKKPNYKLIGSGPTLEKLITLINEKWTWDIEPVCEISEKSWFLVKKNQPEEFLKGLRITKKGNRYRFEMLLQEGES